MALLYGTDGIKQRDYKVWLLYPGSGSEGIGSTGYDVNGLIDIVRDCLDRYAYDTALITISELIAGTTIGDITILSEKLGECRKDSIILTVENGDAIEGNEVGNLVLNKACRFSAELINATPDNINILTNNVDSKMPFFIVLEEVKGNTKTWATGSPAPNDTVVSTDTRKVIFIGVNGSSVASISENLSGGAIPIVTLNVSDNVAKVSDFRVILDVPYDLEDY